jgi:hypothetical protein
MTSTTNTSTNEGIDMAATLEQAGSDALRRSQSMIGQAVKSGTNVLADRIEHYTNLGREIADMLRDRQEPQAADVLQALSARGNEFARYLRNTEPPQLWADAQRFGRDRTWVVTGVGLAGGLALARAVRAAAGNDDYTERFARY